jgi:hypothetical protein
MGHRIHSLTNERQFWMEFQSNSKRVGTVLEAIINCLQLEPDAHWLEALRTAFLPEIPALISSYFELGTWRELTHRIRERQPTDADLFVAAWLLLVDVWIWTYEGYSDRSESDLETLDEALHGVDAPFVRLARLIRNAAFGDQTELQALVVSANEDASLYDLLVNCFWLDQAPDALASASVAEPTFRRKPPVADSKFKANCAPTLR